jgi:hypothetical protein
MADVEGIVSMMVRAYGISLESASEHGSGMSSLEMPLFPNVP